MVGDARYDAAAEALADSEGGYEAVSGEFFAGTSFRVAVVEVL